MRTLPVLLVVVLLGTTLPACGGTAKVASSAATATMGTGPTGTITASAAASHSYLKEDGDRDGDDGSHPKQAGLDNGSLLATYRGIANQVETRAITMLVKRYYAASLSDDAARACALLSAALGKGLAVRQAQLTQLGRTTATAQDARGTCVAAISPLLAQEHQHLATEDPTTMRMIGLHLKGNLALVVLGFKRAPEAEIIVEGKGRAWKIGALFDGEMP